MRPYDGQRPRGKLGQDAGVTPLLFFKEHPGIFNHRHYVYNDHRESVVRLIRRMRIKHN